MRVALVLILGAGTATTALGATVTDRGCADKLGQAESLDELTVSPVDHVAIEALPAETDAADIDQASEEHATPYLYLAPRVASVLRDIFGNDVAPRHGTSATDNQPSSPVAESEDLSEVKDADVDSAPPAVLTYDETDVPLFQRRMYRTDI